MILNTSKYLKYGTDFAWHPEDGNENAKANEHRERGLLRRSLSLVASMGQHPSPEAQFATIICNEKSELKMN